MRTEILTLEIISEIVKPIAMKYQVEAIYLGLTLEETPLQTAI